jgi:hypothetical protein
MKGEAGHHQADSLLANFSTSIIHSCDVVTARWAASNLGHEIKRRGGGGCSPRPEGGLYDELMGHSTMHWNFSEHREPVLDESAFMTGRTGGPGNGFMADAIVIRGEPFADGKSYKRVAFSQKG